LSVLTSDLGRSAVHEDSSIVAAANIDIIMFFVAI
jgi:hypothetical protein